MGNFVIKDENGKVLGRVKDAASAQEAEEEFFKQRDERAAAPKFAEKPPPSAMDAFTSAIPLPGMPFLTGSAADFIGGFGRTEKGKALTKDKSFREKLDMYARGLGANIYSGSTLGIGPAVEAAKGDKKTDEELELSRELYGPMGDIAAGLPFGVGVTKMLPWLQPVTRSVAKEFAPGVLPAIKRIGAGAVDDVTNQAINTAIRSEDYGPGDILDSIKNSILTGGVIESALGLKRKVGKTTRQWGNSDDAKARETAIDALTQMFEGGPPREGWQQSLLDQGGMPAVRTAKSLSGVDAKTAEAYRQLQESHATRLNEGPLRLRQGAEAIHGAPLRSAKTTEEISKDVAYGYNPQYLPTFEAAPRMRNARLQLDLGAVNRNGQRVMTGVTVPRAYTAALNDPSAYTDYTNARQRATDYANRISRRDNRGRPPTDAEIEWYTIRDLEGQGGNAQILGEDLRARYRTEQPTLDNIISSQASAHEQSRAAKMGGEAWRTPYELDTPEGKTALTRPEALRAGFLGELVAKAEKGDPLPRASPQTSQTARRVMDDPRAGQLNELLNAERRRTEISRAVNKDPSNVMPGGEVKKPPGVLRRGAASLASLVAGGVMGGAPGVAWQIPSAIRRFRMDPNEFIDPKQALSMLQIFGEQNMPPPVKKNAFETKGNMGVTTPAIRQMSEQERQKRRYESKRQRELNKPFVEGGNQ